MADMRRTLKVIYFASQLSGLSPCGSFLRNDEYGKPVRCRKYLFYSFILLIAVSESQFRFVIDLFRKITNINSDTYRITKLPQLIFLSSVFTTYLVTAIIRLIGQRNFFKISRKLLSVGSFVNYRESTAFSNAVIALHVVVFVNYLLRLSIQWLSNNYELSMLHFYITGLICDTVTSFAAVQFLYLVFSLRRHFMLLTSRLQEVMLSTVKSENIFSLKLRTVSDSSAESYTDISGLRDILYHHVVLCDILELINYSYSLQVLAFIGLKFVYATVPLYLLWFVLFDRSLFQVFSFALLIAIVSFEIIQLFSVVYCCKSACVQVGIFLKHYV
jgi:hypothetical protein